MALQAAAAENCKVIAHTSADFAADVSAPEVYYFSFLSFSIMTFHISRWIFFQFGKWGQKSSN